jgi:hypothetical protein
MKMQIETDDAITEASETPKVKELIEDYKRCSPWDGYGWNRLTTNEEIRYAVWAGQTPDGKKNDLALVAAGKGAAFPFNGASDTRIMLADEIINESVNLLCVGFQRAAAAQKLSLDEEHGYALKLLDYFLHDVMTETLPDQVELSAQYRGMYGVFVLHPRWVREVQLERTEVKLEQLVLALNAMAAQQGGDEQLAAGASSPDGANVTFDPNLPDGETFKMMVMDPSMDKETLQIMKAVAQLFADQQMTNVGYGKVELPEISQKTLRQALKDLRAKEVAQVPMPYVCRNEPEVLCLKMWDEVLIGGNVTDLRKARVYYRMYLDEVSLKRKIVEEGWDPEWVKEALKHKGKVSQWGGFRSGNGTVGQIPTYDPTRFVDTAFTMYDNKNELVEIVYATYWALDADSVPGVYCTVVHPEVCGVPGKEGELYATHGLLEEGVIPYLVGRREKLTPQVTVSRGVPEIVVGWQREKKVQRDAAIDLLSIAVLPPMNQYADSAGAKYKFGPGVVNTVKPGREPRMMEIPTKGVPLSEEMIQAIDVDAANYFARMRDGVSPLVSQVAQQKEMSTFLAPWTQALLMVLDLAKINMPDDEFSKVTGAPLGWLDQRRQNKRLFKALLHLDVRELDPEYVQKQVEMINTQVVPGDTAGIVNRTRLTQMLLHAINPRLARELITDESTASQKIFDEVNNDIALMFLGNMPHLVENDPTAKTKVQYAMQIVQQNPKYQQELMNPESRFTKLMQMWGENLKFSMTQEKNKQIGRIGVDPDKLNDAA